MRQSYPALDKYGVTYNGYFRLATTVVLGMGITYGKLLYCHGVTEVNVDKKLSTLDYNKRTVYDCFNYPFIADCGSLYMNLPPINIDDRTSPPLVCIREPNMPHI